MTIIRRLNCFDAPKIKQLASYDKYSFEILKEVRNTFHAVLPLKYKTLPETYILLEADEILGMITIVPTSGNPYKINITRLIFKQSIYGKQLVEFIIARFGAKGALTFAVLVDQTHDELLDLFMNGCGFRQCSYENLWKLDNFKPQTNKKADFRNCQNSDAKDIAALYNYELKNLFKPSLERTKNEYKEPIFAGLNNYYKNRYVLDGEHGIEAYLSITTNDNNNFIIDMSLGYDISYDEILNFALSQISARKTKYNAFLKHRQYTKNADELEKYLHERNLNCIQTQCVLIKDFYKQIKQTENVLQIFQFTELSSN